MKVVFPLPVSVGATVVAAAFQPTLQTTMRGILEAKQFNCTGYPLI